MSSAWQQAARWREGETACGITPFPMGRACKAEPQGGLYTPGIENSRPAPRTAHNNTPQHKQTRGKKRWKPKLIDSIAKLARFISTTKVKELTCFADVLTAGVRRNSSPRLRKKRTSGGKASRTLNSTSTSRRLTRQGRRTNQHNRTGKQGRRE